MENGERCREHDAAYGAGEWPLSRQSENAALIAVNEPSKAYEDKQPRKDAEDTGEDRVIARQGAKATERQADYAEISLWVGGLAAIATAWAAIEAGKAARASAAAATEAVRSNEIAQDIGNTQLRAYISIESACVNNFVQGQNPISDCKIKNFGQTPAYKYSAVMSGIFVLERYAQHVIDYYINMIERIVTVGHENNYILGPGGEMFTRVKDVCLISEAEWGGLDTGEFNIYVFGRVQYVDAFNKNRFMTYFMHGDRRHTHSNEPICQMHLYERGNNAN
ncbi:hypothetical protein [Methylocystis sp.]|uniref:hypothetical protein n=1 Tax=Methylocystis sp. TaxID=1911079 RepID=UPI003DA4D2CE